jgi:hypothetical protein
VVSLEKEGAGGVRRASRARRAAGGARGAAGPGREGAAGSRRGRAGVTGPDDPATPPVPRFLPHPRRRRALPTLLLLAAAFGVAAMAGIAQLPPRGADPVIRAIQRAGAHTATGVIAAAPTHEKETDNGVRHTQHGHVRYVTPTWTADVVLTVGHGTAARRVTVRGAVLRTHVPAVGETTRVLYAPADPALPGYVNDSRSLAVFSHAWYAPLWSVLAVLTALLCGLLLARRVLRRTRIRKSRRRLAAAAATGTVHALRVRVGSPDRRPNSTAHLALRVRFPDGAERRVRLDGRPALASGRPAWLCLPPDSLTAKDERLALALVTDDDGLVAWGSISRTRATPYLHDRPDRLPTLRETEPHREVRPAPEPPPPGFGAPLPRLPRCLLTGGALVVLVVLAPLLTALPDLLTWACAALGALLTAGTAGRAWHLPAAATPRRTSRQPAPGVGAAP